MSRATMSTSLASHRSRSTFDRFGIALLVLLLATYIGVAELPFAPKMFGDLNFHRQAKALVGVIRGSIPWHDFEITRAPAPVFYYTIPYLLVPSQADENTYWRAAVIWTFIWMAVSVLLVRRCGEMLGGTLAGKMAATMTLLSPFSVYYSYGVLAEPPAYIGVVLATYGFLRWKTHPRPWAKAHWETLLSCLGLVLFVLSRPNAVLLLGLALLVGALLLRRQSPEQKMEGRFILASVLGAALTIGAVTLSLLQWSGGSAANPQNQNLAFVVLQGRFQFRTILWDFRTWPDLPENPDYIAFRHQEDEFEQTSARTGIPLSKLQWPWVVQDTLHHLRTTVRASAVKFVCLHFAFVHSVDPGKFQLGPIKGRFGYGLFHLAVNACTVLLVIGSLLFVIDQWCNLMSYWVLWGPWLALTAFHVVTYAEARYLFPSRPGMVLMAAAALAARLQSLLSHTGGAQSRALSPEKGLS